MANVLKQEVQEQIRALGRLGWSLRRIEDATGVRRETVARYLRWAGIRMRPPRGRKLSSKAASQVATDPEIPSVVASKAASEVATTSSVLGAAARPRVARRIGSGSPRPSSKAVMPLRSGRSWSTATVFLVATTASSAS